MKATFQRFRRRRRPESAPSEGVDPVAATKAEARRIAARRRAERRAERRARRADDLVFRARAGALQAGRGLRPLGDGLLAFLARIAPALVGGLFALVRTGALLVLAVAELGAAGIRRFADRVGPVSESLWRWALVEVRPIPTYAVVLAVAAVFLGVSQFLHYHGVEVGSRYYEGRVGQVAPAPMTDLEVTGSAHLYLLLPVALLALALIVLTMRGRWQLGRAIGALGVIGLIVSVAADVPQALDAGRAGSTYDSANPELLEGFWIQVCSCAVLAVFGPMLGASVRARAPEKRRARRRRLRRRLRPSPGDGAGLGSAGGARA